MKWNVRSLRSVISWISIVVVGKAKKKKKITCTVISTQLSPFSRVLCVGGMIIVVFVVSSYTLYTWHWLFLKPIHKHKPQIWHKNEKKNQPQKIHIYVVHCIKTFERSSPWADNIDAEWQTNFQFIVLCQFLDNKHTNQTCTSK